MSTSPVDYMSIALEEARRAGARGEVPVGAVLVDSRTGKILAQNGNRTEETHDPTAHAEVMVIREAAKKTKSPRLENCDLYVTLEPCSLCATAISFTRLRRLHFGAYDPKSGGVDHGPRIFEHATCHHRPDVTGGHREQEASDILKQFFKAKRQNIPKAL